MAERKKSELPEEGDPGNDVRISKERESRSTDENPPLGGFRSGFTRKLIKAIALPAAAILGANFPHGHAKAQQREPSKSSTQVPQCIEVITPEDKSILLEATKDIECRYINMMVNIGGILLEKNSAVRLKLDNMEIILLKGNMVYAPPLNGQIPELKVEAVKIFAEKGLVDVRKYAKLIEIGARNDGIKVITPQGFQNLKKGDWNVYDNEGKLIKDSSAAIGCQINIDHDRPLENLPLLLVLAYLIATRKKEGQI